MQLLWWLLLNMVLKLIVLTICKVSLDIQPINFVLFVFGLPFCLLHTESAAQFSTYSPRCICVLCVRILRCIRSFSPTANYLDRHFPRFFRLIHSKSWQLFECCLKIRSAFLVVPIATKQHPTAHTQKKEKTRKKFTTIFPLRCNYNAESFSSAYLQEAK